MSDPAKIEESLRALVEALAASVSSRYKLEREDAARRILAVWAEDKALHATLAKSPDLEKVARTRAYKSAASAARKTIYFALRRYRADGAALQEEAEALEALPPGAKAKDVDAIIQRIVAGHASTAERANHLDVFRDKMLEAVGDARFVLDVGAGVLPLIFPFERAPKLERYVASDRDRASMRAVAAYGRWLGGGRLMALGWDLQEGWAPVLAACGGHGFDVALMLKIVPVVKRQEHALLATLASVPAKRIVVTGSKEALVKRRVIVRREMAAIESFVRASGFRALRVFETPDEIGLIAENGAVCA